MHPILSILLYEKTTMFVMSIFWILGCAVAFIWFLVYYLKTSKENKKYFNWKLILLLIAFRFIVKMGLGIYEGFILN